MPYQPYQSLDTRRYLHQLPTEATFHNHKSHSTLPLQWWGNYNAIMGAITSQHVILADTRFEQHRHNPRLLLWRAAACSIKGSRHAHTDAKIDRHTCHDVVCSTNLVLAARLSGKLALSTTAVSCYFHILNSYPRCISYIHTYIVRRTNDAVLQL